jgi:hypothetical protein
MKFCYKRIENGVETEEEVTLESWVWAVVFKDNTEMHQFEVTPDKRGVFHQIGEVDQTKVKLFVLYKPDMSRRIDIVVPDGAKLIHKYKRYRLNALTPEARNETVYVFGYKDGNHYHFNFIMPSGTVVQSTTEEIKMTEFGL